MEKPSNPLAVQNPEKPGEVAFWSSSGLQRMLKKANYKLLGLAWGFNPTNRVRKINRALAPGSLARTADQTFAASADIPFPVGGYILAGGRSSRMGSDKALLQLAGKPLIQHAVAKLRKTCANVHILSSNSALSPYAPLVADIHPNCGPIGGMESALTHSAFDWNLFLAVDMPFLPTACIASWISQWIQSAGDGPRIRMFTAEGRPQPGFCLLHKEVLPFLSKAINRDNFKLMRVFEEAGREFAQRRGYPPEAGLAIQEDANGLEILEVSSAQQAAQHLWFANLNTPADFIEAEAHSDALDP